MKHFILSIANSSDKILIQYFKKLFWSMGYGVNSRIFPKMKVQLAGPALAAAGQACAACFGGKRGEDPAGLTHFSELLICPVCNLKQAYLVLLTLITITS